MILSDFDILSIIDQYFQGTVLGSFFWGYTMTQFLGGYLSDKIGGDVVLPVAATFWALVTLMTPQLAYLSTDKYSTLYIVILSRVLLGLSQGIVFLILIKYNI